MTDLVILYTCRWDAKFDRSLTIYVGDARYAALHGHHDTMVTQTFTILEPSREDYTRYQRGLALTVDDIARLPISLDCPPDDLCSGPHCPK